MYQSWSRGWRSGLPMKRHFAMSVWICTFTSQYPSWFNNIDDDDDDDDDDGGGGGEEEKKKKKNIKLL